MTKVLFICMHNSARSQMGAAFLEKHGNGRFSAESAGLEAGTINPFAVRAMAEVGIDISRNETKTALDLLRAGKVFQVIIAVCSAEAAERCPVFPGLSKKLRWPFDDPSALSGSDAEIMENTRRIRDQIEAAVKEFVAEPLTIS